MDKVGTITHVRTALYPVELVAHAVCPLHHPPSVYSGVFRPRLSQTNAQRTFPEKWTCDIDFMEQHRTYALTFQGTSIDNLSQGLPKADSEALEIEYDKVVARMLYWNFFVNLKGALAECTLPMHRVASKLDLEVSSLAKMCVARNSWTVSRARPTPAGAISPSSSPFSV